MCTEAHDDSLEIWKLWLIVGGAAIVMYFTVARMIPLGTEIDYFFIGAGTACAYRSRASV